MHIYKTKKYYVYQTKNEDQFINCLFLWEQNHKKETFFVEICGNQSANAIIEASLKSKKFLNHLPKEFYTAEKTKLFLGAKQFSIRLPSGFLSIETDEGRTYFVDNSGAVQGEVFSEQLRMSQISPYRDSKQKSKPTVLQEKHWQVVTKNAKEQRKIYFELFEEDAEGKKSLQYSSYLFSEGKVFRVTWNFHYFLKHVHEKNLLFKLDKDISAFFSQLE